MTKKELATEVATRLGIEPQHAEKVLEVYFSVTKKTVSSGEAIFIRGWGTLSPVLRKKKVGRDIKKNEAVEVPARYAVQFRAGHDFKKRMKALKVA